MKTPAKKAATKKAATKKAVVKKTAPLMQKKKPVVAVKKKVVPKKKEETFLEGAKRIGGNIVDSAKKSFKSTAYDDPRVGSAHVLGLDIEGSDAGTYRSWQNPFSAQYNKPPAEQKRPGSAKKAPAKMKKC
jgi:hypothetical protein